MSTFLTPHYIIAMLLALTIHEFAHGITAYWFGDMTARDEGRLTLNPLAHLDLTGTIMFFIIGFGWAKPVPVDPRSFRHPKRDTAIVALAGPVSNLILTMIAISILSIIGIEHAASTPGSVFVLMNHETAPGLVTNPLLIVLVKICAASIFINLALMLFNLIPIAPLDGSKILHLFIPPQYEHEYLVFLHYGPMLLLGLVFISLLTPLSPLGTFVIGFMRPILSLLTAGFGTLF